MRHEAPSQLPRTSAHIERDTAVAIILANVFTVLVVVGSLVTAA